MGRACGEADTPKNAPFRFFTAGAQCSTATQTKQYNFCKTYNTLCAKEGHSKAYADCEGESILRRGTARCGVARRGSTRSRCSTPVV